MLPLIRAPTLRPLHRWLPLCGLIFLMPSPLSLLCSPSLPGKSVYSPGPRSHGTSCISNSLRSRSLLPYIGASTRFFSVIMSTLLPALHTVGAWYKPVGCRATSPAQLPEQAPWPVPDTVRGGQLSPKVILLGSGIGHFPVFQEALMH